MILCVHIHKSLKKYRNDHDASIRQAWKLNEDSAKEITTVMGFVEGKCVAVLTGDLKAVVSTYETNKHHEPSSEGRFIFLGGELFTAKDAALSGNIHPLLFKNMTWGQGHRYLDDTHFVVEG